MTLISGIPGQRRARRRGGRAEDARCGRAAHSSSSRRRRRRVLVTRSLSLFVLLPSFLPPRDLWLPSSRVLLGTALVGGVGLSVGGVARPPCRDPSCEKGPSSLPAPSSPSPSPSSFPSHLYSFVLFSLLFSTDSLLNLNRAVSQIQFEKLALLLALSRSLSVPSLNGNDFFFFFPSSSSSRRPRVPSVRPSLHPSVRPAVRSAAKMERLLFHLLRRRQSACYSVGGPPFPPSFLPSSLPSFIVSATMSFSASSSTFFPFPFAFSRGPESARRRPPAVHPSIRYSSTKAFFPQSARPELGTGR